MRWERGWKNSVIAVVLLIVVSALSYAGLPVTQRMEEYIAFVLTTDFETDILAEQAQQVAAWADDFSWARDFGLLWHRLEAWVTPSRRAATHETVHDAENSEAASGWDER